MSKISRDAMREPGFHAKTGGIIASRLDMLYERGGPIWVLCPLIEPKRLDDGLKWTSIGQQCHNQFYFLLIGT